MISTKILLVYSNKECFLRKQVKKIKFIINYKILFLNK